MTVTIVDMMDVPMRRMASSVVRVAIVNGVGHPQPGKQVPLRQRGILVLNIQQDIE